MKKEVSAHLTRLMYAETEEIFEEEWKMFQEKYSEPYSSFVRYMSDHWVVKKTLWSKCWRKVRHSPDRLIIATCINMVFT